MASHWRVRNTIPTPFAPVVPPHSKVHNWMPPPPPPRHSKVHNWMPAPPPRNNRNLTYFTRVQRPGGWSFAPINRSGWGHSRKRKNRKTRRNR